MITKYGLSLGGIPLVKTTDVPKGEVRVHPHTYSEIMFNLAAGNFYNPGPDEQEKGAE